MSTSTPQNYKVPSTSKVSVDHLLRVGYYELEKTIGKGNFAVVKLASNIVTKSKVAIKIIDKTCLNEEYLAKTYREISILKSLRHTHITRLYEVMQSKTMIYLVTEYASNGEIFDHLVDNGRMKEPEAARVFTQLVSAVQYCHSRGVVHRDLKAENVLLDKDMNIKLADFGFSNRYEDGSPLRTWCGSPPYAAPEVFQGLEYDGPRADIWSLGVVLYALVCGALPFDGRTLLELKSHVVTGKFRIPYFMSQECEHLIRNMLVVEPERRYTLKQIIKHRWLSEWATELNCEDDYAASHAINHSIQRSSSTNSCNSESMSAVPPQLDSVVMTHMLQLPGLTADLIAQSVHEKRFDKIYAIYNLLYDKLQQKRREQQRLQHHANLAYSRSRKTSITTGVVDRSEPIRQESVDRLSPLTNTTGANINGGLAFQWSDVSVDLEKYGDFDLECVAQGNENQAHNQNHLSTPNAAGTNGNTRRHTVGPGDVAHEQALANPNVAPLNFKCTPDNKDATATNYLPMNLPMMQNQPLHNLTTKDQHLLKPPMVMGASSFGRRASDGGANLHIYYPSSAQNMAHTNAQHTTPPQQQQLETPGAGYFLNPNTNADMVQMRNEQLHQIGSAMATDGTGEESSDEIQRYMQIRGCTKRHTVGCTDDLSVTHHPGEACCGYEQQTAVPLTNMAHQAAGISSPASGAGTISVSGNMRTRRTGLLTVTERPPVISPELIREVESRMKRNYLPPALKMQTHQQQTVTNLSQSPPTNTFAAFSNAAAISAGSFSALSSNVVLQNQALNASSVPLNALSSGTTPSSMGGSIGNVTPSTASTISNSRRIYGRACKLPTVQEVGRYSPVRRASEGSKAQFQGPLQECQYLQKGIAQRNFLVAPSTPLLENSISLPGSPIHGKAAPHLLFRRALGVGQDVEIPPDAIKNLMPVLERMVKEQRINLETANKILSTGIVPAELAIYLGLTAHSGNANALSGGHLDVVALAQIQQQQIYSSSVSPLSLPCSNNNGVMGATSNPLMGAGAVVLPGNASMGTHSKHLLGQGGYYQYAAPQLQFPYQQQMPTVSNGQFINYSASVSNSSSGCQSPVYNSFSGSSSPNPYLPGSMGGSSPLHQITKGLSILSTGGGGSITRGTSAASEVAAASFCNQPLDLSMDVCGGSENSVNSTGNWFKPPAAFYDLKPLNLSPAQPLRVVPTPPASPNLCIIQEENANGQMCHTITTGMPYAGCTAGVVSSHEDMSNSPCQPSHPQICLTDVQGSEITLVALSSENSRDSDCDSLDKHTPLMSLQGLIITEPSSDMPSITRGIGRKTSLENENHTASVVNATTNTSNCSQQHTAETNRRGSDKSLGFSDDSLSNDSNNLSPCQEPSASSGFKSDSHSEIGDHTEGHLTPDSIPSDSRRMSDDMCYEVPLPHECSNLDSSRILEIVKQTIDSTLPAKGFILHKGNINDDSLVLAAVLAQQTSGSATPTDAMETSSTALMMETDGSVQAGGVPNLSLEYAGGLQIELQVCEGRGRDNQSAGKGIKLRRISGDQNEYGKLCQQLISDLKLQQVAG